jgi:hypothetical protein
MVEISSMNVRKQVSIVSPGWIAKRQDLIK